jgi:small subunit ribosomal protein S20
VALVACRPASSTFFEAAFFAQASARTLSHKTLRTILEYPAVANIKSQIKRNGTNARRHERNKAVKSELKTSIRAAREATESGDAEAAAAALKLAARKLDKAVSKGVIHKNQAANRKSALAKKTATL